MMVAANQNSTSVLWCGDPKVLVFDPVEIKELLRESEFPVYGIKTPSGIGFTHLGQFSLDEGLPIEICLPTITSSQFGDPEFLAEYGVRAAYYAGAMANGIASADMVIALGKEGLMGSFGAGGLSPLRVEEAIQKIQSALPNGPYLFNLLNNPYEPSLERATVDLYIKYGITAVEAAAYVLPSESLVYYRVMGLSETAEGQVKVSNRVLAKISRREVAEKFMSPPPERMLKRLLTKGVITEFQAELARRVPLADDISAEADSGGHTDNRPMVGLLPSILSLRDELQEKYQYNRKIRVGIGGGISTPESLLAAFMMGAAYVVTGSINHASVEAGTSDFTKVQLSKASMTDVIMAPSADMFEMGVKVQVLKRGTMYAMRAQKLYDTYQAYEGIEEIPLPERQSLEKSVFQRNLDDVWADTVSFFKQRDPSQIEKANQDPKKKMALIFRWYLGLASRWSCTGENGRETDYQIWCGPSMGVFNDWVHGTYLESLENRSVVDIANHLLSGCVYQHRIQQLKLANLELADSVYDRYLPKEV